MLGDRIQELRKINKITQQDLADMLSVAKSTVGMWENNKREPDVEMIKRIADYFNVSVDYLVDHENNTLQSKEPDIRRIERARNNMPTEEKERMMNTILAAFGKYFSDDFVGEDTDE